MTHSICPTCGRKLKRVRKDYKYLESGLKNVIIIGLPVWVCSCGEEMPEFKDLPGLHKAIALAVAQRPEALSGSEFRFLRKVLKISATEIAKTMGVTKVTVSRWENDKAPIGTVSEKLIRALAVQALQEKCGRVFKGAKDAVTSFKRTARRSSIKVGPKDWEKLCRQKECAA